MSITVILPKGYISVPTQMKLKKANEIYKDFFNKFLRQHLKKPFSFLLELELVESDKNIVRAVIHPQHPYNERNPTSDRLQKLIEKEFPWEKLNQKLQAYFNLSLTDVPGSYFNHYKMYYYTEIDIHIIKRELRLLQSACKRNSNSALY